MATTFDTYTNVPGSPAEGDTHYCTDCPIVRYYVSGAWTDDLTGYGVRPTGTFPTTGWTAAGAWTAASLSQVGPGVAVIADAGSTQRQDIKRAQPTPPYTITTILAAPNFVAYQRAWGIGFYDSGSTKGVYMRGWDSNFSNLYVSQENPLGVTSAGVPLNVAADGGTSAFIAVRIENDGTNLKFHYGTRVDSLVQVHSETIASFMGTVTDVIVFGLLTVPGAGQKGASVTTFWSWDEA